MKNVFDLSFEEVRDAMLNRLEELRQKPRLTEDERIEYNTNLKWARDYYATMKDAKNEGSAAKAAEIALKMKNAGMDTASIAQFTGLSETDIANL